MPEIDVRLERVSKMFGDVAAVDDLSLDIEEGEFFSMLGPSGCGKTTTLRMIGGFEDPTYGTVYLGGRDVTDLPPYKRDVNTVFQSYALFPHLDVKENVAFGLRRKKVDKAEVETRKPPQMSGGQQQRVALARALVNHPKVLLLDEPLGALDLKLRKQMQLELKRIQQEVGITFIYVTHDQEEALTMSDRIAVMNRGRVEQVGTPEDVYGRPATTFVAGFIGVSNLMPATVVGQGEVRLDQGPTVPAETGDRASGERCHAVVRPEKLHIDALGESGVSPNGLPRVEGTVESSVYLGTATQIVVDLGDGVRMTVLVPNASEAERRALPGGGVPVVLSWEPESMHLVRGSAPSVRSLEESESNGSREVALETTREGG